MLNSIASDTRLALTNVSAEQRQLSAFPTPSAGLIVTCRGSGVLPLNSRAESAERQTSPQPGGFDPKAATKTPCSPRPACGELEAPGSGRPGFRPNSWRLAGSLTSGTRPATSGGGLTRYCGLGRLQHHRSAALPLAGQAQVTGHWSPRNEGRYHGFFPASGRLDTGNQIRSG